MPSQTTPYQVNDPIINEVRKIISSPTISPNAIAGFNVVKNSATGGADVSFSVSITQGIQSINLLRGFVNDVAQASVLQTWSAIQNLNYIFPDAANIANVSTAYYWIILNPQGTSGTAVTVGPQSIGLSPNLSAPPTPGAISASHGNVANGSIQVWVNVSGVDPANSIRIGVAGYHGNPSTVFVAQGGSSPVTFFLDATFETVQITASAVTPAGVASPLSGVVFLVLGTIKTTPAAPPTPTVVQFSGGNQISWQSSGEPWVVSYFIYRGQRGQIFLLATNISTVAATTQGTVSYVDSGGLTGDWAYYIVAHSITGDSNPSAPGSPAITYTSSVIPPNVPGNTTNNATIDSIDSGTNAIARIYGPGGAGTSYLHYTGYGTLTRPNGVITGLAYNTNYFIMYDTAAQSYSAYLSTTGYPGTLPDSFEYVGFFLTITTTGAHGSGATAVAATPVSGGIPSITPTNVGSGYISGGVTVSISGGGGSGASAIANVTGIGGNVSSYTMTNNGTGYSTSPPIVVVVTGNAGTGSPGGGGATGGSSGYRGGCVEEGTPVDVPHGTISELVDCEEWVEIRLGPSGEPVLMHPDTMVGVWKKAKELTAWSRINVADEFGYSKWRRPDSIKHVTKKSKKVKRVCPGGVYRAGKEKILLHNVKYNPN